MSIQANFPAIKPTLLLDFANTESLDPRITFTRASTGTYYDGKTVAKAEENLLTWSQDFDNAAWTKSATTVTANGVIAPDGTLTADKLVENTATSSHFTAQSVSAQTAVYALSTYAKAAERSFVSLGFDGLNAWFNLSNGTTGTVEAGLTASITDVGNGWYRCAILRTVAAAGSKTYAIYATTGNGTVSYTGDGTSGIYAWGAQLEQRASATAYTPTTTQPVTNYIPVLLTAASGVPRFEHNPVTGESLGLEIEEQRTNLFIRSEEFDNAAWTKSNSTITANTIVSPDGTLNADKLNETATTASFSCVAAPTMALNTTYTLSLYMKAAERNFGVLNIYTGATSCWTTYNLSTGVISTLGAGATATITPVGNGWYRCTLTISTASSGTPNIGIWPAISNNVLTYTGTAGYGIYIWGAQLEAGAFPTSYIPTVASQVTRAADSAVMTGANFSSWYRPDEGTLFAKASGRNGYVFWARDSSAGLYGTNVTMTLLSNGTLKGEVRVNSVDQAFVNTTNSTPASTIYQAAFAYKRDDFAASLNAGVVATDTNGIVPSTINQVQIGGHTDGVYINGTISRITYYPQRLSNAQLQALTS